MKNWKPLLTLLFSAFLASCANEVVTKATEGIIDGNYSKFRQRDDYRVTKAIYKNESLYNNAVRGQNRVRIDLSEQRAQLLVGPNRQVAIDTPVCTGKPGKATPPGTYRIMEKIADKRSNLFGSLYKNGSKVFGGDRRKYGGSYDKYVGAPLPYWMRMTGGGIGMHGSNYVHRNPRSNGCVRTPPPIVDDIYNKMNKGDIIEVVR